ncbi:MAG: glycosyltransferase family 4 protein [Planctomycetales bacterium]|nr:glycosyltransferase family 4 protein [Planctomycetales bacterium]
MIVYVTRWLGGYQGAGKSAWDALGGILATGRDVHVVAGHAVELPAEVAGHSTHRAQVESLGGRFSSVQREAISRSRRLIRPLLREPRIAKLLHGVHDRLREKIGQKPREVSIPAAPSLIVVNSLGSHDEFLSLDRPHKTPAVLIVRESPGHYTHRGEESYRRAVQSMTGYDALIFVSNRCRDAWLQESALREVPAFYVPNCCEEPEVLALRASNRTAIRQSLGFAADRFVAVCVASLQHRKGQDLLVSQLPRLVARIPHLELHLVGADSRGFGKELRSMARQAGLERRLCFHGASDSALACLYAADALVLPTRAEAMPRVVLEAMALGTPIVATSVDGIPELVQHDAGGWLFAVDRPHEMLEGLSIIAHDQPRAHRWVAESERRYWAAFSRDLLTRRYAELLNNLVDSPSTMTFTHELTRVA